jgi:NAD(P)-dependent dehydrogenase (short-subunit alcohol dehydrogenase family)
MDRGSTTGGTAAVVTGHTRGLGEAIAGRLLEAGVRVLGLARSENAALGERYGGNLSQVRLDLADAASLEGWLREGALADFVRHARTALLVNNAGVVRPTGPLETQEPAEVARAVSLNVSAALVLSAAFVGATSAASDRRILHVSSGAGSSAYAGWSVYCATKAALDHHARAVALDRTPRLRVAAVAPGVIDTDMQAEIRATDEGRFPDRPRFLALKREGRLASPGQAARALVEFLRSDSFGREPVTDLRRR